MRIGKFVDQEDRVFRAEGTNICGILVHVRVDKLATARQAMTAIPGVEINQCTDDGRMIVIVEDTADEWAGQILTRFPTIEGVLSTSLVYHHCEAGDLEKEFVR
jgi:nitrate reductase NapD